MRLIIKLKIGLQQSQELGNSIRKRYFENKYANSSNVSDLISEFCWLINKYEKYKH